MQRGPLRFLTPLFFLALVIALGACEKTFQEPIPTQVISEGDVVYRRTQQADDGIRLFVNNDTMTLTLAAAGGQTLTAGTTFGYQILVEGSISPQSYVKRVRVEQSTSLDRVIVTRTDDEVFTFEVTEVLLDDVRLRPVLRQPLLFIP